MEPMPSSSARSFDAVRVESSAAVPLMVTDPVGSSLVFPTALVAELVAVSGLE
ncbi:uncharacterized protein METZ01_LOCUS228441 [marine metagenome]|uniref:Uncharacterized protein n=1 Tax=marine metagenome TaxID=408172 RepID=A0A382GLS4_9ZZZZ